VLLLYTAESLFLESQVFTLLQKYITCVCMCVCACVCLCARACVYTLLQVTHLLVVFINIIENCML
jgi:hypothetical protein